MGETKLFEADVERGAPSADLSGYAAGRGLEFLDGGDVRGFEAVLPRVPGRRHNVMAGELGDGETGVLFHEVVGVEVSQATRSYSHDGPWPGLHAPKGGGGPWWSFIPVVGWFATPKPGLLTMPFTTAGVAVPEATAHVPRVRIDRRRRFPPYHWAEDDPAPGLAGWHLHRSPDSSVEVVERLLAGSTGDALGRSRTMQLVVSHGMLAIRELGYLAHPGRLDALAQLACRAAAELREACAPLQRPQAFADRLPRAPWAGAGGEEAALQGWSGFAPMSGHPWRRELVEQARRLGLEIEDAKALHRAWPRCPVPGQAAAVLGGALPGLDRFSRLARFAQLPLWTGDVGDDAVLLPAPDAADTPGPPVRDPVRGLSLAVRDGVLAAFRPRSGLELDLGLVADGVAAGRERGLL